MGGAGHDRGGFERLVGALRGWFDRNVNTLVVVAVLLAAWQFTSQVIIGSNLYLPSPVYTATKTMASSDLVWQGLQTTLIEVLSGFIAGLVIGIPLGIVMSESFLARRVALPWIVFIYAIPAAIIAPLFLVWFGVNLLAISLFVSMLSFFPIFISMTTGVTSVEEEYYQLGQISGATRWQMIKHVKFWVALPYLFTGIRIGIQSSVVGAIVAEFIASGSGLGFLIVSAYNNVNIGLMFGTLFVLMVVAIVYYQTVDAILTYLQPVPTTE